MIIGIGPDDPEPDWEEAYRPMRQKLEHMIPKLESIKTWGKHVGDVAPDGEWKPSDEAKIKIAYFRDGAAHCPIDAAKLAIAEDHTTGEARLLSVVCRLCRRQALNL
jgi:hypothetical protein